MEIHGDIQFPLYSAEGRTRTRYYLPPISGGYYTPFLWCDGRQRGTTYSTTWRPYIESKLSQPAYATITSWGVYLPAQDSGRIYVQVRNDSTGIMKGYIRFVLTEDSCYYVGPNGDPWHNHVARDYLPDTSGTFAQLVPQESVVVFRDFLIQSSWNEDRCKIIYWYQNDSLRADSSKPVYQAGTKKLMDMAVAVEEIHAGKAAMLLSLSPNPCKDAASFQFQIPVNADYALRIFDISGSCVRTMTGVSRSNIENAVWNLQTDHGNKVGAGVYLYEFGCDALHASGKIIVY